MNRKISNSSWIISLLTATALLFLAVGPALAGGPAASRPLADGRYTPGQRVPDGLARVSGNGQAGIPNALDTSFPITFVYHDLEDVVQVGESVDIVGGFTDWGNNPVPLVGDAGAAVFSATLTIPEGAHEYKFRAQPGDNWDWLNTNNRSLNVTGNATVDAYRAVTVGWAKLQWPPSTSTSVGVPTENIYGRVYIQNVTNPTGQGRGVRAQLGYGTGADPSAWSTWDTMPYFGDDFNNDEFAGTITPIAPGVYDYLVRFDGNWGTGNPNATWTYGDLDGPGIANRGVLTVTFGDALTIAEIRIDQSGVDNDEYFELAGFPSMPLSGLTYLVLGDATGDTGGVIEAVADLSASFVPADGYFLAAESTFSLGPPDLILGAAGLNFENSDNVTHLLVAGFTGANGQDLDTNNDGVLDITPWNEVLDCVALLQNAAGGDLTYCATTVGPDGAFVPGQVYLCDAGWQVGLFFPLGATDTPGEPNRCAGLSIDKTGPATALPGEIITYTLSYSNTGLGNTLDTLLTDTLPLGVLYQSDTSGLPCSCSPGDEGEIAWDLGTLPYTTTGTFEVTVLISSSVPYGVVLTNTLDITTTSALVDQAGLHAEWLTAISPLDLAVSKSGPPVAFAGEDLVYTLVVEARGVVTVPNTILTDTLPISTTYVADTSAALTTTVAGGQIVWEYGTLAAGAVDTFVVTLTLDAATPFGASLTNTVEASTTSGFDNTSNNTSMVQSTAYPLSTIATARAGSNGQVFAVEGQVIYTPGTFNSSGWALQDATGGIAAFYSPPPAVNRDDLVRLVATRGSFSNEEQLGAPVAYFENLGAGPTVDPSPYTTGAVASGSSEGWLVEVEGVIAGLTCPTSFNYSLTVDDGSGPAIIFVDGDTGVDLCGLGAANGNTLRVAGFSTQFNADFEIKPRDPADVALYLGAPAISKAAPANINFDTLYTYTINLQNFTGFTLDDIVITDVVPGNVAFAFAANGGIYAGGVVTWMVASLADQGVVNVRFAVTSPMTITSVVNAVYGVTASNYPTATFGSEVTTLVFDPGALAIHDLQGAAHLSPLNGASVQNIHGIVTAVDNVGSSRGFWMQTPDAEVDGNLATSEGIFVYTGSTPPGVALGDEVNVGGTVDEYYPGGAGTGNLPTTQLESPSIAILSSSNPLPAAIVIGAGGRIPPATVIDDDGNTTFDPETDGLDFYESLEGMRLQVNDPIAVGAANNFGEIAIVGDNGANAGVFTGNGGLVVQPGDFNPERLILDDFFVTGEPDVHTGASFAGPILGVLDYTFGNFKLLNPDPLPAVVPGGIVSTTLAFAGDADHLSIVAMNVLNLDPGDATFAALANEIVNHLHAPDIFSLEEIQDNTGATNDGVVDASETYGALITAILDAGGPLYDFRDIAPENNTDGGEPGGNIRVGFLFRPDRVTFVDRPGADATTANAALLGPTGVELLYSPGRIDPTNIAFDDSRKPLAGEFIFDGRVLFVIANHFNSKSGDQPLFGINQPPVLGSEAQRLLQAQVVNDFVDSLLALDPNAGIVVLGDLNDFPFSNPLATLKGAVLTNLVDSVPLESRYSYIYDGNSQVLDHILVSYNLSATAVTAVEFAHLNADFDTDFRPTDHDPIAALLYLPPLEASFTSNSPVMLGELSQFTSTVNVGSLLFYEWDFGDGISSTLESPTHTYAAPGIYPVILEVSTGISNVVVAGTHEVLAPQALLASFTSNSPVTVGEVAVFTNTTTGAAPITSLWDFGDGITSTLESPTHTYAAPGTYTVTLTASNPYESGEAVALFLVEPAVWEIHLPLLVKNAGATSSAAHVPPAARVEKTRAAD